MANHKTLPQSVLHEALGGTTSHSGFSVFSSLVARQTSTPVIALASGMNTIFTCPAGKKAIRTGRTVYNTTGSPINFNPVFSYGGFDYTGSAISVGATSTSTSTTAGSHGASRVFSVGDVLKVSAASTGLQAMHGFILFDDDSPVFNPTLDTLVNGNNTLYTCPVGKTAAVLSGGNLTGLTEVAIFNNSGGSVSYSINVVESGGSVSASNQILPSTSVSNNASANISLAGVSLAAGDFISVNSSAATTNTAVVSLVIFEMDA